MRRYAQFRTQTTFSVSFLLTRVAIIALYLVSEGAAIWKVVPSLEVLTRIQLLAGGTQFVHCREVVRSSECLLSEVPLYLN